MDDADHLKHSLSREYARLRISLNDKKRAAMRVAALFLNRFKCVSVIYAYTIM